MLQIVSCSGFMQILYPKYSVINDFLRKLRSGEEVRKLQQLRTSLNAKNASSSEAIKDIVFERYRQFIDTSKEVSREFYILILYRF